MDQCPTLFGAQTAGELQEALRRRNRHFSLTDCYFMLCSLPCSAKPCCRPDGEPEAPDRRQKLGAAAEMEVK